MTLRQKLAYSFGGAFAVIILASTFAFTSAPESKDEDKHGRYVLLMSTEVYTDHGRSEVEISYGDDKIEHIELKKYHRDNRDFNLNIITNELNRLHNEGYDVITNSIAVTNHHKVELFVLERHRTRVTEFK